jgi:hypothetical protein
MEHDMPNMVRARLTIAAEFPAHFFLENCRPSRQLDAHLSGEPPLAII